MFAAVNRIVKPIDANVRKTILLVHTCASAKIVITVVLKRMTIPIEIDDEERD